MDSFVVFDNAV